MSEELSEICTRLEVIEGLLRSLVRQRMSNKEELLHDEVKKRGSLAVTKVMGFLNISRTHALTIMRKVGNNPGFNFRKGGQKSDEPSVIGYSESMIVVGRNKKINQLLDNEKIVPLHVIKTEFGMNLEEAKQTVADYMETNKNCEIVEGNKLRRKNDPIK